MQKKKSIIIFVMGLFTLPLLNTRFSENESSFKEALYQNTTSEANYLVTINKPHSFYLNFLGALSLKDEFNLELTKHKLKVNWDIQPFFNNNHIAIEYTFPGFIHEYRFLITHQWFFWKNLNSAELNTMKTLQSFIELKRKKKENRPQLFNHSNSEYILKSRKSQTVKQTPLAIPLKSNSTNMPKTSQINYDKWPKFLEGEPKQNLRNLF
ncbi:hypothetical protein [Flavobacterium sp. TBRC 19031]|uniref:hypothetical protein n=1 Tax=Flavobacterium mekongense TaxID=3379707 RepID=UPI00399A95DE